MLFVCGSSRYEDAKGKGTQLPIAQITALLSLFRERKKWPLEQLHTKFGDHCFACYLQVSEDNKLCAYYLTRIGNFDSKWQNYKECITLGMEANAAKEGVCKGHQCVKEFYESTALMEAEVINRGFVRREYATRTGPQLSIEKSHTKFGDQCFACYWHVSKDNNPCDSDLKQSYGTETKKTFLKNFNKRFQNYVTCIQTGIETNAAKEGVCKGHVRERDQFDTETNYEKCVKEFHSNILLMKKAFSNIFH